MTAEQAADTRVELHTAARDKVRRLSIIFGIMLLAVALAALVGLVVLFTDKQSDQNQFLRQSEQNADTIDGLKETIVDLEGQLAGLRLEVSAVRTEEQLADDCVDFAAARYDAAVGNLLVVAVENPTGDPDRERLVGVAIEEVTDARDYLNLILDTRPRPTDCPPPIGS